METGDFEPEGWSAFDDHGGHGAEGNAGCGCAMIVIAIIAILVTLCGGCVKGATDRKENPVFEIPLTLVEKMQIAFDANRNAHFNVTNDLLEFWSIGSGSRAWTNALEITGRPRGEMKAVDDLLSEKDRLGIWPFDIEGLEEELTKRMVIDTNGLYRLKGEFVEGCPVCDDGQVAANPTIRYINWEIERFATNQMDRLFPRMVEANFCAMSGDEKMPDGTCAWTVAPDLHFVIQQRDGAWEPREYMFIRWTGDDDPFLVALFDSFPSKKEACATMLFRDDAAAINNLAVMMWRHQCDRMSMRPAFIKILLERAVEAQVPTAERNLQVLRAHVPEVFVE